MRQAVQIAILGFVLGALLAILEPAAARDELLLHEGNWLAQTARPA
jgi:hypothetical protein